MRPLEDLMMTERIETNELVVKDKEGRVRIRLGVDDLDEWGLSPIIEVFDAEGESRLRMRVASTGKESPNQEGLLLFEEPNVELIGREENREGLCIALVGNDPVIQFVSLNTPGKVATGRHYDWIKLRIKDRGLVVSGGKETPLRHMQIEETLISEINTIKEQLAALTRRLEGGNGTP